MKDGKKLSEGGNSMEKIIDFSNSKQIINKYGGADTKKTIIYNNKFYLLKFPNNANQNKEASYSNNIFSEYLGCHIFNLIGIKAQNTILGTYKQENGIVKNVCACEDFTGEGWRLVEFQNLKNSFPETSSSSNGRNTSLSEILDVINNHTDIDDKQSLKEHFWNMFIVDGLIGNDDDCNEALKRIMTQIDMIKIEQEIDSMLMISDIRRKFYKIMINERYEKILKYSYNKLLKI